MSQYTIDIITNLSSILVSYYIQAVHTLSGVATDMLWGAGMFVDLRICFFGCQVEVCFWL